MARDIQEPPVFNLVHASGSSEMPLVLFLPGLSGNVRQWDLVRTHLDNVDAALAYGAPILPNSAFGGGRPTVTRLAELLAGEIRAGNYHRVIVVAHSVGSFVALGLARMMPKLVTDCILINGGLATVARFLDHPAREFRRQPKTCLTALRLFLLAGSPAPERVKRAIASNERTSRLVLGDLVSSDALGSEQQRRAIIERGGSTDVLRALWDNRHHWQEYLGYADQIEANVLFVVGDQDPMTSERDTRDMAGTIPSARVKVLHGIGHMAPLETAAAVARLVRDTLAE